MRRGPGRPSTADYRVPAPRPLTTDEILCRDLTCDAPNGFPLLSPLQSAFVKHRAQNPTSTWAETYAAAGYSETYANNGAPDSPAIRTYLSAIEAGRHLSIPDERLSPSDLRRNILRRLACDATQDEDGRVRVAAAKVWLESVPPDERAAIALADLSEDELLERLKTAVQTAGDHVAACLPAVSLVIPDGSPRVLFPSEGNSALDWQDDEPEPGEEEEARTPPDA